MHRFQGHFFDLTIITSGTSNFDLTPCEKKWFLLPCQGQVFLLLHTVWVEVFFLFLYLVEIIFIFLNKLRFQ